ncbi:hypothetical protein NEAUS05_1640 [Nematocida ausubeli]|nr:hypothetical protein NEAUS05_1640 [Nematocida ausubeli]
MFEYKQPISSILDGPRFTIAQIGNAYCVVAPVNNFYKVYGAERLNTLGRCKEGERIQEITSLGRYIVTAAGTRINIYNQGVQIQEIEMGETIKTLFSCNNEYLIAVLDGSVAKIELDEIDEIENKKIAHTVKKLRNIPDHLESVHPLALKNKILVVAGGVISIYSVEKDRAVYKLKCTEVSGPVLDVSCSISSEIIAVCTSSEVLVLQLKKDILLQTFSFGGIQSVDFRRSSQCKELAVLTKNEVIVLCLEQGVVRARHALPEGAQKTAADVGHLHTARYIGSDGYLVISQYNELQILDCHKEKILSVKRRAGVVFGKSQCSEFLNNTLVISTNNRVYTLSLRKDEQLKEISKVCADGEPVSLSVVRDSIIACYTKGVYALKETVGGVAQVKRNLGYSTPREYIECAMSFCGNSMALAIKTGKKSVKILITSKESGFIFGEIEETPYLAISLNNLKKTLTVLHRTEVVVYTYNGEVVSRHPIQEPLAEKDEKNADKEHVVAKIFESSTYKYFIIATWSRILVINQSGETIKSVAKRAGAPISARVSADLSWLLLLSSAEKGAVLEVVDIQAACTLSTTFFAHTPRDFLLTHDKSRLVVTTDTQVLLYVNTYSIQAAPAEQSAVSSQGISFSSAHKSRIRLLMMYDTIGDKVEEEAPMAPYTVQKENTPPKLSSMQGAKESIEALLDGNYPISSIVAYIKEIEDPSSLVIDLISHLEAKYDIADALINRVLHYRRKDLDMERLSSPLKTREAIAERLIVKYLSTLSLIQSI